MKVVFGSTDIADLSAIQSVCVSDTDGKIKILVGHKTKGTEKVSSINFRGKIRKIHYSPDREITTEFAEEIVKNIEDLTQNPDMPMEQVIGLKVWASGYLQVDLDRATEAQAAIALARLCCDWIFGRYNAPSDEQLKFRTGLDISDITRIVSTDDYKQCVEDILIKARTSEEFKAWVEESGDMRARFGKRMRLCEDDAQTLLESVARYHGIACIRIA